MVLAALVAAALGALGCEADLVEAIDELRAAAPTVCKDYCEDKLACEWPTAEGVEEEAAFSEGVERCTVDCAFYMGKGAYVVRDGVEMVEYFDSVSGSTLLSALECAMENGTFRCTEGDPNDVHVFGGIVESMCEDADECLDLLDIDQHLEWIPSPEPEGGGTCVATGDEWIDADFFLP
jgi:hypothetical protein